MSIPPDGYCWMFATYRLPPNYSGQCSSALEEEDRNVYNSTYLSAYFCTLTYLLTYRDVYTSYYQWVPPFLIASACLFYLPR